MWASEANTAVVTCTTVGNHTSCLRLNAVIYVRIGNAVADQTIESYHETAASVSRHNQVCKTPTVDLRVTAHSVAAHGSQADSPGFKEGGVQHRAVNIPLS